MPYSGTGTYSLVYNWEQDQANGILVRADRMDTQESDIATALSTCLLKDGTQTVTANIPMATFKFTNLGYGTSAADSVTWGQVFNRANTDSFSNITMAASSTFDASASTTCRVPTATAGTNTTAAASTAFVQNVAMTSALPNQTGNSGKVVMTDGAGTANWTSIYDVPEFWMN